MVSITGLTERTIRNTITHLELQPSLLDNIRLHGSGRARSKENIATVADSIYEDRRLGAIIGLYFS